MPQQLISKYNFKSNEIFSFLNRTEVEYIKEHSRKLHFKKGSLLFHEYGIPTGVYLLEYGRAKIYKTGFNGKEQIFYIYKEGDLLGYHALICHENYEDSCEAIEDCEISFISKDDFLNLLKRIPKLQDLLINNLGHEFGVMVNIITLFSQKTVRERLALFLLILEERFTIDSEQPGRINLTRDDLANMIGTARETLINSIKEFKERKWISVNKRTITILNHQALKEVNEGKQLIRSKTA
ncbi:MAG: Crp/Fnr family transcriptional regulator [Bacteroidota bacterium]